MRLITLILLHTVLRRHPGPLSRLPFNSVSYTVTVSVTTFSLDPGSMSESESVSASARIRLFHLPVKISRSAVKVGDVDSSECSDIDIDECLSALSYHPREGVPGFEVETQEDAFWAPIAHRTC